MACLLQTRPPLFACPSLQDYLVCCSLIENYHPLPHLSPSITYVLFSPPSCSKLICTLGCLSRSTLTQVQHSLKVKSPHNFEPHFYFQRSFTLNLCSG